MTRTRRLKVDHNLQRSWRKQRRLLYNIDWLEVLSCAQAARLEPIEPPSDADDDASFLVYGELVERLTASRCAPEHILPGLFLEVYGRAPYRCGCPHCENAYVYNLRDVEVIFTQLAPVMKAFFQHRKETSGYRYWHQAPRPHG